MNPSPSEDAEIQISSQWFDSVLPVIPRLKSCWAELQPKVQPRAFLSWEWIGLWLRGLTGPLLVVEAHQGDELVGVGLFCPRKVRKFGLVPTKQLWLNRCGEEALDQIWIEYNDCLVKATAADSIRRAIYGHLFLHPTLCDELYVGLATPDIEQILPEHKVACHKLIESSGFRKHITGMSLDLLLESFSANTRKQIRRSIKLLSELGTLELRPPRDQAEHGAWLSQLAKIHRKKWGSSEWGSGFDNPHFYGFHQTLLQQNGRTELLALTLNEQPNCFLYNLLDEKGVYFYLSAIPDETDNRIKLGLVAHTLAMVYYSEKGFENYDFLAGESRYKKSLSDEGYLMAFYCIHKKSWLARLEHGLRSVKQRILELDKE